MRGKTTWGKQVPLRSHRCRSRKTRSSYRSDWQTTPGPGLLTGPLAAEWLWLIATPMSEVSRNGVQLTSCTAIASIAQPEELVPSSEESASKGRE